MINRRILIAVLISIVLYSCNKDNEFDFALIQTGDVTDINSSGATFHARVSDLSNSKIVNYGFVWSTESNPEIQKSEKYIIKGAPSVGTISEKISTTLKDNVVYYVRAFMQNDKYITYGKDVVFTSLGSSAPDILDFFPKTGNLNDTLYIIGSNFSYITDNNKVTVDNYKANVIYSAQDTLVALIPDELNVRSSTISVSIFGNATRSTEKFNLIAPVLTDFENKTGTFGSQITISGNNFLSNPGSLKVNFGTYNAVINEVTNMSLTVNVPIILDVRECTIKILMNNLIVTSTDYFRLAPLVLDDFSPETILTGEKIILTGTNFSPIPKNNKIQIGGIQAEVVSASINKLEVVVPLQDKGIYPDRNVNISVEVIGESDTYNETLLINDKWFRLADFPGSKTYGAKCFVADNDAFVGLNNTDELWRFNPVTQDWMRMNDFPGSVRYDGAGFFMNGNIYFGTGYLNGENFNDFWQYEIASDSWIQKNNFTGSKRTGATGFSINDKGYVTSGHYDQLAIYNHPFGDCWEYSPESDSWSEIESYDDLEWGDIDGLANGSAVVINGLAYYGIGWNYIQGDYDKRVYKFDPGAETKWQRIANFPKNRNYSNAIAFVLNEAPYFKTVDSDFYQYIATTDTWTSLETKVLSDIAGGIGFSFSGKAYVGLGMSNAFWEYDPAR